MSNALAIAAVTAALKDVLNEGLLGVDLSTVGSYSISATPPDRITTGATEPNQLNLFLYQVTPNPGWRNAAFPSRDAAGARLRNPPLALDLHYMLSAYGAQDLNAEVLLGYAMQLLHETPVLTRAQLRTVLGAPSPFGSLSALNLADQIEILKISPNFLSGEELSKLWTAMQARYRPSMAYTVSVVLIQSEAAARSAPPVLQRGAQDRGPAAMASGIPSIASLRHAASELMPAVRLGDDLLLTGSQLLGGTPTLVFENIRLAIVRELAPLPGSISNGQLRAQLPLAGIADWGIGLYSVSLRLARPDSPSLSSNAVPIALAPSIVAVSPLNVMAGDVTVSLECRPRLRPPQESGVRLLFGAREIAADSVITPADPAQPSTMTFTVPQVAAGSYPLRLRVDGIDSLPVSLSGSPPLFEFDPQQTVTVS